MTGERLYDEMGVDYEMMVDWDARIANETPFFGELFQQRAVRRVADVACGVGRHAIVFASWGLDVVGVDPSEELLAIARANAGTAEAPVRFVRSDFLSLGAALDGGFDALVCIGNSLQHLLSADEVAGALGQMNQVLVPGGTLVVQNRAAERIWARGTHLLKPALRQSEGRDVIFQRMVDVHAPTTTLNVIRLDRVGRAWQVDAKATDLRPISQAEMAQLLARTGFGDAHFYGDYKRTPFAGEDSEDLLVVAAKTGNGR